MKPEDIMKIVETIVEKKIKYFWLYIIASVILVVAGAFFMEFLKTKGQNLATKTDIEVLTSKVESVKLDYLKKIEKYKNELSGKYELEKTLLGSKVKAYRLATSLKTVILKWKSKLESEKELMNQFLQKIPELLIHLMSHYQIRTELQDEINALQNNYNEIVLYLEQAQASGDSQYHIELVNIEKVIDNIQKKILM